MAIGIILISINFLALGFIFLYNLTQFHLTVHYLRFWWKNRKKTGLNPPEPSFIPENKLPFVTIQLPVFNEIYVIERLIDAVAALDYPLEKFEIQILDDSTDETTAIVAKKTVQYQKKGLNISHICRENRQGYKAGALQAGLCVAKGDFVAIFDADFLPSADFLRKTLPHFQSPEVGVVQTRWRHLNENYSILTRLQAFALDAHFSVEQQGRNAAGYFINFNGTAGIWRKKTIEDAGGWEADTLTEDLDLSYRAQLKGWRFVFLEHLDSPAELPAFMPAIKSQQFRWTKGAAEVARKNLGKVLRARLPLTTKIHAIFHLLNSGLFICILLSGLVSVPLTLMKENYPLLPKILNYTTYSFLSVLFIFLFFGVSRISSKKAQNGLKKAGYFILFFPVFIAISMGMALHNALATLEGYVGFKTPFIRTPKFNLVENKENWKNKAYLSRKLSLSTLLEGILFLYFASAASYTLTQSEYGIFPFLALLAFGYGTIFFYTIKHTLNLSGRLS